MTIGSIYKFSDIDWIVLDVQDNKLLLLSENIIENRKFDSSVDIWEQSELYNYLNGEFYNRLTDKTKIEGSIFLLSVDEVKKYFKDNTARIAKHSNKADIFAGAPLWWLRDKGLYGFDVASVSSNGIVASSGASVSAIGGVRPALWLIL